MGIDITGKFGTPDAAEQGSISAVNDVVIFEFSGASAGISISGTWNATLVFEATIDKTVWFGINALRLSDSQIVASTTTNGNFIVACSEYAAMRVRCTSYSSGTADVYIFGGSFSQLSIARQPIAELFNAQVVGNIAAGVGDSGNPIKIGGVFNATLPSYSNGQRGDFQLDTYGRLRISADLNYGSTSSYTLRTITNQGIPANINNAWPILITDGDDTALVNSNHELMVCDIANNSAVYGELIIGTSPVEGKIGSTALSNRKYVVIEPFDKGIYFGFSNSISINNGFALFKHQLLVLPVGQGISIWFVANNNNRVIRFGELA